MESSRYRRNGRAAERALARASDCVGEAAWKRSLEREDASEQARARSEEEPAVESDEVDKEQSQESEDGAERLSVGEHCFSRHCAVSGEGSGFEHTLLFGDRPEQP